MNPRDARGTWMAWACIALGLVVLLVSALRLLRGSGGLLALLVGLPLLAYGVFMLRAVRRVRR